MAMRFLYIGILLISAVMLPPTITFLGIAIGIFLFADFYESLGFAQLLDVLYRGLGEGIAWPSPAALSILVLFVASYWIKEIIRLYHV